MAYRVWCHPAPEWIYFYDIKEYKRKKIPKPPDFKPDIDAKWCGKPKQRMIVEPDADDFWRYLLVDGSEHPTYKMIGWYYGHECKQPMWLQPPFIDRDGALRQESYFVPRETLRPMSEWRFDKPYHRVTSTTEPYWAD